MLAVKNFDKFQHYKDRSPVWIKLYRSLLRDYEFAKLSDAARGQLVLIWLLASEMGNRLPNDAEWIKCQINASDPVNLAVLIETGFLIDCDSENASNYDASESDSPEKRERERERREEKEKKAKPAQSDEEWLVELQANPAYAMLDVQLCYHRAVEWCKVNNRQPTRKFFINWLGREHKPMTAKIKPPTKANVGAPAPLEPVPLALVNGFMSDHIDGLIAANDLIQLGNEYDAIIQRGGAKAEWEIRCVAYYELHKDEPATPEQMAELDARIQALAKR